jgi:hypothetical protein
MKIRAFFTGSARRGPALNAQRSPLQSKIQNLKSKIELGGSRLGWRGGSRIEARSADISEILTRGFATRFEDV